MNSGQVKQTHSPAWLAAVSQSNPPQAFDCLNHSSVLLSPSLTETDEVNPSPSFAESGLQAECLISPSRGGPCTILLVVASPQSLVTVSASWLIVIFVPVHTLYAPNPFGLSRSKAVATARATSCPMPKVEISASIWSLRAQKRTSWNLPAKEREKTLNHAR